MKTRGAFIKIFGFGLLLMQSLTCWAQPVTKIAAGGYHTLFLKGDGSLWAMGNNRFGGLGDGTSTTYGTNRPSQIVAGGVTVIAAGGGHSLFIKSDGSLWGMGWNAFGQLGDGTINDTNRPMQLLASNVTAIAAGDSHSLFLKKDGSLWAMGYNKYGELGDGIENYPPYTNRPEKIVAGGVMTIAAGFNHSLFLKTDGSLWAMGYNEYGQLGDGTTNNINYPEQIVASNVTAIAAGGFHSLFLKSDGSLWAMGDNYRGQLGDGTFSPYNSYGTNRPERIVASGVIAITAGANHSLFLKSDGSLWAMGDNFNGQLGDGTYNYIGINLPEQIETNGVTGISAGAYHSMFVKSDGSLWAMGDDEYGQLGDGTYTYNGPAWPEQIVAGVPFGFNKITGQRVEGGKMRFAFVGVAGKSYALDRTGNLSPASWLPLATNLAAADGTLVFTNLPNPATNNFWRIRFVP